MHGRPRKPLKPEDAASKEKASKLRILQSQLLHNHHNKIYTKEALDLSSKLVESNPELYTAWNYRKLAVEFNLQSETNQETIKSILDEELRVVEAGLRRNFKSYGAWHHRKWVLSKGLSSTDHEFKLLDQFQKADSRNFHAWNYRRFVASLKNVSEKEELDYTTAMIENNFSNYSAWHNRSAILSSLLKQKAQEFASKEKVLANEYDLVHNAIFTEPADQSGWFYHLWLLDQTITPDAPVLVSSWPIHGSDLILSSNQNSGSSTFSRSTTFCSKEGTFPLILYFNQTVEGVSSFTVKIKFMFSNNEEIKWTPLSANNSGKAQAWMAYLKFPEREAHSSTNYPVEVSVGNGQGIVSSNGSNYSYPSRFAFTVSLLNCKEDGEGEASTKEVVWKDDSFHTDEALQKDLNRILSFDGLRIIEDHDPTTYRWQIKTIVYEIALFRELLLETNCKIGKLTLARLLMAHDAMMSYNTSFAYNKVNTEEVLELFSDLMRLDPYHSGYYKGEHSLVLVEKVISEEKSLLNHCFFYGESSSLNYHSSVCLRLNNLSLSRIGSFEHVLWVRMLDLSHNELQSIEGLEALQLLSCLNLSNNKFRSFTALEPLRLLKSLKVLNLSHNEIGSHSIDTTRYLCSSPLSHTQESNWYFDDLEVVEDWEAVLLFKDLQLTQLDVVGNAVSDEKFRILLVKLLPKLKWLDGEVVK